MKTLRRTLDALYTVSGVLAAVCMVAILVLILLQMLARWTGEVFPGAPDYAGYAMAAASFLGFANTLQHGAHIRVSILLNALDARAARWLDTFCFAVGAVVAWWVAFYTWRMIGFALKFNDVSQGQDATPLWIPQSAMLVGAVILAIALSDNLIRLLATGRHGITRDLAGQSRGE